MGDVHLSVREAEGHDPFDVSQEFSDFHTPQPGAAAEMVAMPSAESVHVRVRCRCW
jgi:hypothetical protein